MSGARTKFAFELVNALDLSLAETGSQLGLTTSGAARILQVNVAMPHLTIAEDFFHDFSGCGFKTFHRAAVKSCENSHLWMGTAHIDAQLVTGAYKKLYFSAQKVITSKTGAPRVISLRASKPFTRKALTGDAITFRIFGTQSAP